MFNFLWKGCSEKHHVHLCRWEVLKKTKYLGRWGIRNINLFDKALATNTLWRVLIKDDIWHRVIKDKYLPYCSLTTWLRSMTFQLISALHTWKNLLKYIHLLTNWLSWSLGLGHSVKIVRDKILGLGNSSYLSQNLLFILKQKKHYSTLSGQGNKSVELYLPSMEREQWIGTYRRSDKGMGIISQISNRFRGLTTGQRRRVKLDWGG